MVLPGIPYHVTQRGNRRGQTFFVDEDYALYRDLLAQSAERAGAEVWCCSLMPNRVHIVVVPTDEDARDVWQAAGQRRLADGAGSANRPPAQTAKARA